MRRAGLLAHAMFEQLGGTSVADCGVLPLNLVLPVGYDGTSSENEPKSCGRASANVRTSLPRPANENDSASESRIGPAGFLA